MHYKNTNGYDTLWTIDNRPRKATYAGRDEETAGRDEETLYLPLVIGNMFETSLIMN